MFKRLLWTSRLSASKNGLELARLYQALCYYSSAFYELCIEDSLSTRWFEIADDVFDKLTLIDKGCIDDVSDEYLEEIRNYLLKTNSRDTNRLIIQDESFSYLREHIYESLQGHAKRTMPVYIDGK